MGALWLEVVPRRDEDVAVLMRDYAGARCAPTSPAPKCRSAPVRATPLAHNFLATKYLQAGRVPTPWRSSREALRLKPRDAEAHSNLASALQMQGRLAEAMQHVREAVRLKPDDDRVRFNLGNALSATGHTDEAIREFAARSQLNPENADAHFNLGVILGPRNRIDEAIVHLRRAVEINPRTPKRTGIWRWPSGSREGLTKRLPKPERRCGSSRTRPRRGSS